MSSWICAICRHPQSAIICTTCPEYAQRVRDDLAAERECAALDIQRRLRTQQRWLTVEMVLGAAALVQGLRLRRRPA